jgi:hypothetical protein
MLAQNTRFREAYKRRRPSDVEPAHAPMCTCAHGYICRALRPVLRCVDVSLASQAALGATVAPRAGPQAPQIRGDCRLTTLSYQMLTSAMHGLIGLSFEMGIGNMSAEEARNHVSTKQEMIHEAIHDALARARDDFDMAMTLVDTSKSLITRDMLFRRRAGPTPEGASRTVIMAATKPQFADQY